MKVAVFRKEHFNAAHRLHNPDWSAEKNKEIFGLCNNANYHGHNYELIIQSSEHKESYVAGAIGPLPDADKKLIIASSSTLCIIIGMGGLGIVAAYEIKNKRKSV